MLIYKIFRADEWAQLQAAGATQGAPIDLADGFIHFSTAATVEKTAALYFAAIVFWLPAFYISRISMKVEKSLGLVNDGGAERT